MNPTAHILSVDHSGRGVARPGGKTTFIANALPHETVRYRITQHKAGFDEAEAEDILVPSPHRRTPRCPHYGECGGCSWQHVAFEAQVALKQRIFEEQLWRIGKTVPETLLPPVYGSETHYRERARLTVSSDGNGRLAVGYQARQSHRTVPVRQCLLLPAAVSSALPALRDGLQALYDSAPDCGLDAVEIHCSGRHAALTLHLRRRQPENALRRLSGCLNGASDGLVWQIWQKTGSRPAEPSFPAEPPPLAYRLPEYGITMPYRVGDFTQINSATNALMVSRTLGLLDPQPHERIADLFCGLGNFSLPLARSGAAVHGIEGEAALTRRARSNARANGIGNAVFSTADLFRTTPAVLSGWGRFDKILLDPPRAGAHALVQSLHAPYLPQRIAYVSCNPATLARDAAVLAQKGYRLRTAGIFNLFAQTAHVEAVALFELG